jgi:hypothetical protein
MKQVNMLPVCSPVLLFGQTTGAKTGWPKNKLPSLTNMIFTASNIADANTACATPINGEPETEKHPDLLKQTIKKWLSFTAFHIQFQAVLFY